MDIETIFENLQKLKHKNNIDYRVVVQTTRHKFVLEEFSESEKVWNVVKYPWDSDFLKNQFEYMLNKEYRDAQSERMGQL